MLFHRPKDRNYSFHFHLHCGKRRYCKSGNSRFPLNSEHNFFHNPVSNCNGSLLNYTVLHKEAVPLRNHEYNYTESMRLLISNLDRSHCHPRRRPFYQHLTLRYTELLRSP